MSLLNLLPKTAIVPTLKAPASLLIIGGVKIGKTVTVSHLKNAMILCCDPKGANYIEGFYVDITAKAAELKVPRYNLLRDLCVEMAAQNPPPYQTLIIDKVDNLEQWAEGEATAYYKSTIIGKSFTGRSVLELPDGNGYGLVRESFMRLFSHIMLAAPQIIFLASLKDKFIDRSGAVAEFSRKDIHLTGKLKEIFCSQMDAIGFMSRSDKDANWLTFKTREKDVLSGSRCPWLEGKIFKISQKGKDGVIRVNWNDIYPDEPKVDLEKEGA